MYNLNQECILSLDNGCASKRDRRLNRDHLNCFVSGKNDKKDEKKRNAKGNKNCFRNIYAPHGAKFRFIFSVEAKPV